MKINQKYPFYLSVAAVLAGLCLLWIDVNGHLIGSDALYPDAVVRDLLVLGGDWRDWKFSPAPDFFPDMLLYLVAFKVFPEVSQRLFFVSALQVLETAFAILWLAREIRPGITWRAKAWLLGALAFFVIVSARTDMWLFFFTSNGHFASLIFSLVNIAMTMRYFNEPKVSRCLVMLVVNVLAVVSTKIYIISFVLPAIVLATVSVLPGCRALLAKRIKPSAAAIYVLFNVLSLYIARALAEIVTRYDAVSHKLPFTVAASQFSARMVLTTLLNSFTLNDGYRLAFSLFVAACAIYWIVRVLGGDVFSVQATPERAEAAETNTRVGSEFAGLFFLFILVINVSGAIVSGGYLEPFGFRYFSVPIAYVVVLAVVQADREHLFDSAAFGIMLPLVVVAMIVFSVTLFLGGVKSKAAPPALARCIDDIEKKGFVLQSGVAQYWNSRGLTEYLPHKNWIMTTDMQMKPLFWMSSLGPIRRPEHYGYHYNFAILRDHGWPVYFDYGENDVGKLMPVPDHKYYCAADHSTIWLYDDDALDLAMKNAFTRFLYDQKWGRVYRQEGSSAPGVVGRAFHAGRRAVEAVDGPGILTYGPYLTLAPGQYRVTVWYAASGDDGHGYLDIIGTLKGVAGTTIFRQSVGSGDNLQMRTTLTIPPGGVTNFEVRSWFSGHGMLLIRNMEIAPVDQ